MARVIITQTLKKELFKKFKEQSVDLLLLMKSMEQQPKKGKALGSVGGIVIKELKYQKFRFYFITDGHCLKFGTEEEVASLIIKFVALSEKKDQEKKIDEIKKILVSMGFDTFQ